MEKQKKPILILDANAFISMLNLNELGSTHRLVTTSDVLQQLRDQKTRTFLAQIAYQIEELNFDEKSLQAIKNFAKKTGDVGSLSDVDMELLALTHTLYVQEGLGEKLRKQPLPIQEKEDYKDIQPESSSESEEYSSDEQTEEQKKSATEEAEKEPVERKQSEDNEWITVPVSRKQKEESSDSEESDEEAWVTPKNYTKKMAEINSVFKEQQKPKSNGEVPAAQQFVISLVSADFAMQNVATQMGMQLLSLDGRKITEIRRFIWECYLCWKQYKIDDNAIRLCSNCGYNSLSKIAYSIDCEGKVILHRKKGWKPNDKIMEWKDRKLEEQEKNKKHQHARRKKKPSIFES